MSMLMEIKIKLILILILYVLFIINIIYVHTYCRVFPRQRDKKIYVGLGFERIFIGRLFFTLTNTINECCNTLAPLISVKWLLLCLELSCPKLSSDTNSAGLLPSTNCYTLHSGWIGNTLSKS
jgi:hypothetical protein